MPMFLVVIIGKKKKKKFRLPVADLALVSQGQFVDGTLKYFLTTCAASFYALLTFDQTVFRS